MTTFPSHLHRINSFLLHKFDRHPSEMQDRFLHLNSSRYFTVIQVTLRGVTGTLSQFGRRASSEYQHRSYSTGRLNTSESQWLCHSMKSFILSWATTFPAVTVEHWGLSAPSITSKSLHNLVLIFTVLQLCMHGIATIKLSVRLSIKRVDCEKTKPPSDKSSIMTNRKSTTSFPVSLGWTAYVALSL